MLPTLLPRVAPEVVIMTTSGATSGDKVRTMTILVEASMGSELQIMAWQRAGDKPLFESVLAYFGNANMRHLASMG